MEIDKNPEVKKPGHALWTGKQAPCLLAETGMCVFLIHICDCPRAVLAAYYLRACPYSPSIYTVGHVPVLILLFQTCCRLLRRPPFEAGIGTFCSPAPGSSSLSVFWHKLWPLGRLILHRLLFPDYSHSVCTTVVSAWVSPVTSP